MNFFFFLVDSVFSSRGKNKIDRYLHDAIVQLMKMMEITFIYTEIRSATNQREKKKITPNNENSKKTKFFFILYIKSKLVRMKQFSYE